MQWHTESIGTEDSFQAITPMQSAFTKSALYDDNHDHETESQLAALFDLLARTLFNGIAINRPDFDLERGKHSADVYIWLFILSIMPGTIRVTCPGIRNRWPPRI